MTRSTNWDPEREAAPPDQAGAGGVGPTPRRNIDDELSRRQEAFTRRNHARTKAELEGYKRELRSTEDERERAGLFGALGEAQRLERYEANLVARYDAQRIERCEGLEARAGLLRDPSGADLVIPPAVHPSQPAARQQLQPRVAPDAQTTRAGMAAEAPGLKAPANDRKQPADRTLIPEHQWTESYTSRVVRAYSVPARPLPASGRVSGRLRGVESGADGVGRAAIVATSSLYVVRGSPGALEQLRGRQVRIDRDGPRVRIRATTDRALGARGCER